jgi:hypothetical protein
LERKEILKSFVKIFLKSKLLKQVLSLRKTEIEIWSNRQLIEREPLRISRLKKENREEKRLKISRNIINNQKLINSLKKS